jgi:hypothetical protein
MKVDGTERETIAPSLYCPLTLEIVQGFVYWGVAFTTPGRVATTGQIQRAQKTAPRTIEIVHAAQQSVRHLAADANSLFFCEGPDANQLLRRGSFDPDGGVSPMAPTGSMVTGVAVAGADCFVTTTSGNVLRVAKNADAGADAAALVSTNEENPGYLAATPGEGALVWSSRTNSRLRRFGIGNASPTTLADVAPETLFDHAAAGDDVYFLTASAQSGLRVLRVPLAGGTAPEVIATLPGAAFAAIAADATALYIAHQQAGSILRLALP